MGNHEGLHRPRAAWADDGFMNQTGPLSKSRISYKMPHGVFLPSWSDKITVKSQGHTLGQILWYCHYFRGRNGWKSTNLMKFNTIILSGLKPRTPNRCNRSHSWRGMARADHQHLHICFWGSNFPRRPLLPLEQIHMVGNLWTVWKIHCVIPQIPSLVDNEGKSIWGGHILDAECSWQVLSLKFSLKQTLLSLSSFWKIHAMLTSCSIFGGGD